MSSVLFVDDFEDTADTLADIASALGHQSAVAYSGGGGLANRSRQLFDVIFLDLTLPDGDGRDVCLHLRQSRCGRARIIALTGHSDFAESDLQCSDGFLLKPPHIDDLERLLV